MQPSDHITGIGDCYAFLGFALVPSLPLLFLFLSFLCLALKTPSLFCLILSLWSLYSCPFITVLRGEPCMCALACHRVAFCVASPLRPSGWPTGFQELSCLHPLTPSPCRSNEILMHILQSDFDVGSENSNSDLHMCPASSFTHQAISQPIPF